MVNLTKEEESLRRQGNLLKELKEHKGWQEVLLPFLRLKLHNSWVDPREGKDNEEFMRRYNLAFAFAKTSQEIIDYIDRMIEESEALTKKEKDEEVNVLRDAVS